jgi:hypothetical protein
VRPCGCAINLESVFDEPVGLNAASRVGVPKLTFLCNDCLLACELNQCTPGVYALVAERAFIAWDAKCETIFIEQHIPAIKEKEKKTKKDIEDKKEELRQKVGCAPCCTY